MPKMSRFQPNITHIISIITDLKQNEKTQSVDANTEMTGMLELSGKKIFFKEPSRTWFHAQL